MGSVPIDWDKLDVIYQAEWRGPTTGPDRYPLFPEEPFPQYHDAISQLLVELDAALMAGPDGQFLIDACPAGQRLLEKGPGDLPDIVLALVARDRHGQRRFDSYFSNVTELTMDIVWNVGVAHPEFQTLQKFRGFISFALESFAKKRPLFDAVQMESLVSGVSDDLHAWLHVGLASTERCVRKNTLTRKTVDMIRLISIRLETESPYSRNRKAYQRTRKLLDQPTPVGHRTPRRKK